MSCSYARIIPSQVRRSRWFAFAILGHFFLTTASAYAQSPTVTLKEFGLFGTWADDCNAKASAANQYAIFSVTSRGAIELRNDFGPNFDDMVYRIVDAKRLSHFRLSLRQLLTTDDQITLNTVMMKANDRIRIWSSHGADGSAFVEDGSMPSANGQKTGWMVRCDVKWTGDFDLARTKLGLERSGKSHSSRGSVAVLREDSNDDRPMQVKKVALSSK
jgi:hypothetical protein